MNDIAELRDLARHASTIAYAPHSGFSVGAVLVDDKGNTIAASNLETASWSVAVHAEVAALVRWRHQHNVGHPTAVVVTDRHGEPVPPCGQCRQVLVEHLGGDVLIDTDDGWVRLGDLLPYPFKATRLSSQPSRNWETP